MLSLSSFFNLCPILSTVVKMFHLSLLQSKLFFVCSKPRNGNTFTSKFNLKSNSQNLSQSETENSFLTRSEIGKSNLWNQKPKTQHENLSTKVLYKEPVKKLRILLHPHPFLIDTICRKKEV